VYLFSFEWHEEIIVIQWGQHAHAHDQKCPCSAKLRFGKINLIGNHLNAPDLACMPC